jgi:hypothetical protein
LASNEARDTCMAFLQTHVNEIESWSPDRWQVCDLNAVYIASPVNLLTHVFFVVDINKSSQGELHRLFSRMHDAIRDKLRNDETSTGLPPPPGHTPLPPVPPGQR